MKPTLELIALAEQVLADKQAHVLTTQQRGKGATSTLPVLTDSVPDCYEIDDSGRAHVQPPYLVIRYADGHITLRSYHDERTMSRAHVQTVKPTGVLPVGTRVVAVYLDGARVEKVKRV